MNSRVRSAIVCALLITVSLAGMRYGRDENYLPYKDYGEHAKEVFFSCDGTLEAGAVSYYSANNILSATETEKNKTESSGQDTDKVQVLPPVINPPDGIEAFDEAGT
jgi:hypothetical protein